MITQLASSVSMALQSLASNKMRALLTMLGIIIGVGSVITMTAIGQGAAQIVAAQINSMGTNMLQIDPGPTMSGGISSGAGGSIRLTDKDAEAVKQSPYLDEVAASVDTRAQVIAGNANWLTRITGSTPAILPIRNYVVERGSMFTEADAKTGRKVCLLGKTVATNLFGDIDAISQTIRIKNVPCMVIGILKEKGVNSFGQDQDDNVLAPLATVQRRIMGITWLEDIFVSTISPDVTQQAIADVSRILRIEHRLQPTDNQDFRVRSQVEMAQAAAETTATMTNLLSMAAIISLVVGGIGIMNIMLVSVTERTREIGIRKSIGAKGFNILLQFLTEAVTLSLVGGAIGILLGYVASSVVSSQNGWSLMISSSAVGLSFSAATFVGVFFGWYPARKAARMNPIEALRHE
ncbi:MAG: ABC transporter permease [Bacteroidota bacterium]|nr:ABC transporter permease [Bacteroidota bacterium]